MFRHLGIKQKKVTERTKLITLKLRYFAFDNHPFDGS